MLKKEKIFVLDTSVLLHDHQAITNFKNNNVTIPITVLEELDKFKVGNDTKNFCAREVIRFIDKLSIKGSSNQITVVEKLLDEFTKFGNPFGDHPDMKKIPGVDFSSGSLGHGLSIAAGIALSGRISGSDHKTWCMLGDGELCEGQIWEAAMFAGHHKLGNLVAIVDNNQLCIDGFVKDVMNVEPIDERFASFGWVTRTIDGHDLDEILDTMSDLPRSANGAPHLIVAKTIKGRGVKRMELSTHWHVGNLVGQDYEDVMTELSEGLISGTER